jgi:hypothetical protein
VIKFCGQLGDKPTGPRQLSKALRWSHSKTYRIAELATVKGLATKRDGGGWTCGTAKTQPTTANGPTTAKETVTKALKAPTQILTTDTTRAVVQIDGEWLPSKGIWDRGMFWATKNCPCGGRLVVRSGEGAYRCMQCKKSGAVGVFDGYQ